MNITIIGGGEVGCVYAEAFSRAGYTLQLCTPRPSEKVLRLEADNKITVYIELDSWLKETDIVVCCTPGSVSLAVAKETIPYLKKEAVYADFSTSSPDNKIEAASLAISNKLLFVDVAIMGSVALHHTHTPLICSGHGAEKIASLMQKIGSPIRILPNSKVGDAAFLKLLRSVFMKGLSALTIECVVAAKYYGLKDSLYENLIDLDNTPISEFLDMFLRHHVVHACRQQHEVSEAAKQLKSSGLPVQLLPAIESLFKTTCEFIKSQPLKNKHPTTEEALDWLIKTRCEQTPSHR